MSFRRFLFSVLFISFVVAAGDVMACEGCFGPGQKLPGGAKTSKLTCWTYDSGVAEGCYVEDGYQNCDLWSYNEDACPVPPPSSGGGGNSGGGGTGGSCRRDSTGACPPECTSCGSFNDL